MFARRHGVVSTHTPLFDENARKKKVVQRYAGTLLFTSIMAALVLLLLTKYNRQVTLQNATAKPSAAGESYNDIFDTRGKMFNKANTVCVTQ
jgi:hypothetical protein